MITETTDRPKTFFELSLETQLLVALLVDVGVGETIPYARLAEEIGEGVQAGRGYARLSSARRIVQRDHNAVFAAVPGQGLRRLDGASVVGVVGAYAQKAGRAARRAIRVGRCVDVAELDNAARIRWSTQMSIAGVLLRFTQPAAVKRIAAAVSKSQQRLPVAKTLAALGDTKSYEQ